MPKEKVLKEKAPGEELVDSKVRIMGHGDGEGWQVMGWTAVLGHSSQLGAVRCSKRQGKVPCGSAGRVAGPGLRSRVCPCAGRSGGRTGMDREADLSSCT